MLSLSTRWCGLTLNILAIHVSMFIHACGVLIACDICVLLSLGMLSPSLTLQVIRWRQDPMGPKTRLEGDDDAADS